jgi:hypothetical protein
VIDVSIIPSFPQERQHTALAVVTVLAIRGTVAWTHHVDVVGLVLVG